MITSEKARRAELLVCDMLAELSELLHNHGGELDRMPGEPFAYVDDLHEKASDAYDRHNCVAYVTPLAHAIKRIRQVVGLEVTSPVCEPLRPCECVACGKALHWIFSLDSGMPQEWRTTYLARQYRSRQS